MNPALRGSQDVPLGLLRRYLRAHDWRTPGAGTSWAQPVISQQLSQIAASFMKGRGGGKRDFEIYLLSNGGSDEIEITLPTDTSRHDFLRRIDGALDTLAAVEHRSPDEVAADIRSIGFDRVFSRIPDSLVIDNSIQLEIAAHHIRDLRRLLAATATTELSPAPSFPRTVPKAIEYADSCRFAHTFDGSFGFTIELPLQPNVNPTLSVVPENAPFERRVMERFARGVQTIIRAADEGDTKPIVDSVAIGFSANACEQFAQLIEDTSPGGMGIGFAFSPEWRTSTELVHLPSLKWTYAISRFRARLQKRLWQSRSTGPRPSPALSSTFTPAMTRSDYSEARSRTRASLSLGGQERPERSELPFRFLSRTTRRPLRLTRRACP